MRALEVHLNGERLYTAGFHEGVFSAHLTWLRNVPHVEHQPNREALELEIGGIDTAPDGRKEQLRWPKRDLQVGDVVEFRVVQAETIDEPAERQPWDPEDDYTEEQLRKFYEYLKERFEEG